MPQNNILIDVAKVGGTTFAAATMTFSDVNTYLTTASIVLAIAYTLWKWVHDARKLRNEKK
tara:strand:- start:339 stop:521 length:183 start_codon:yes stop_codon:yes gene_type:complete